MSVIGDGRWKIIARDEEILLTLHISSFTGKTIQNIYKLTEKLYATTKEHKNWMARLLGTSMMATDES